ncbi:LGFP repeat-containing protein [Sinomonas atrocyanea]
MEASSLRQTTGRGLLGKGGIAALVLGLLLALTTTGVAPQAATAAGYTAIDAKYQAVGGSAVLGAPRGPEVRDSRGGAYRDYARGTIYWSNSTGTHVNSGAIRGEYAAKGWQLGPLGYPTTDEVRSANGGVYQSFQGGTIYWSPAAGAHANAGAIRAAFAQRGWELGYLGYPTTGEYNYAGGRAQNFQNGYITWTPRGGTAVVVNERVIPGGFCSPSQVWMKGVASNGRWYTCGSKGRDASGHYHWNS